MNHIKHVAIIMDGNGRWGLKKGKSRNFGHREGIKTVEMVIKESIKKKIKFLTLFVFSTENWKRPLKEINYLFSLLNTYIDSEIKNLKSKGIKIKVIGNLRPFDILLRNKIKNLEKLTKFNEKIQINMALNYGSREEIINAINKVKQKKLPFTKKNIEKYL